MRSRRRTYIFLSTLVGLALAGLIVVQVAYLDHAYDREFRIFSQNVNGVLHSITRRLETREAWVIVNNFVADSSGTSGGMTTTFRVGGNDILARDERIIKISDPVTGTDSIKVWINSTLTDHGETKTIADHATEPGQSATRFIKIMLVDTAGHSADTTICSHVIEDSDRSLPAIVPDSIPFLERRYIIEKVLEDMSGMGTARATDRIEPAWLDSIMTITLSDAGINTEYAYGIASNNGDSLIFAAPEEYGDKLSESEFRTRLFPHDLVARDDELLLYFPDQSSYLLGRESAFLILALLSIILLAGCYIFVIRTLWRQKRFSRQLIDFINNMTHEFKTPVSTIAIVGENLGAKQGSIDTERLANYARILKQESGRMKRQVEKILEMAALEEGDFNLDASPVDLHALLMSAVEGVSMRIEPLGGKIETAFATGTAMIEADPTHLGNVFHNLLDNAAKYTVGPPHIVISTSDEGDEMVVTIKDNGIGIKNEDLRHIFDRYFRISTGDLHDVKGFGLGLSYVRLIVEAHGGSIIVSSSQGKGSSFRINLPKRFQSKAGGAST
ncbi:MAG: HAMP domain-containing histidine kinase [Bacteroidales bacterium]|nr:HAMP domain-containing histidine kinase [Candidatus Latescibacterota bacterium]